MQKSMVTSSDCGIRWTSIESDMFRSRVFVVLGKQDESREFILKKFKVTDRSSIDEITGSMCAAGCMIPLVTEYGTFHVMWISEESHEFTMDNCDDMENIVHESEHAINGVLRDRGLSLTKESEETYAYMKGWFVGKIFKWLKKTGKAEKNDN